MVSHWSLRDNTSPKVSMTLLSILANLNNAVVWMSSTRPVISKTSSPSINPLVTVPKAPIIIEIIVTFMFHSFVNSLARPRFYPPFHFPSISICSPPGRKSSQYCKFSFCCWLLYDLVVWLRLGDPFVSRNSRRVSAAHSLGQILGCAYTICSYGQISTSCTFPSGLLCPPSRV